MMIYHQKKVNLGDEDANTRINLNSTSGIYLTAAKVAQYRQEAENMTEMDEAKKYHSKEDSHKKGSSPGEEV